MQILCRSCKLIHSRVSTGLFITQSRKPEMSIFSTIKSAVITSSGLDSPAYKEVNKQLPSGNAMGEYVVDMGTYDTTTPDSTSLLSIPKVQKKKRRKRLFIDIKKARAAFEATDVERTRKNSMTGKRE